MDHRTRRAVRSWVSGHRDELVDLARHLIRTASINHPPGGDEGPLQAWIADHLRALRAEVEVYEPDHTLGISSHPDWRPNRDYHGRPNVFARLPGVDPRARSLAFCGHIDTVGLPGDCWTVDPLSATVDGDHLIGLGSFDMKGSLASAMMALQAIHQLGLPVSGDVALESVVDEEYGGANGTLAGRLRNPQIAGAVLMEPTNLRLCPSHRGGGMWRLVTRGRSGLAFSGEAVTNPVWALGRALGALEAERDRRRDAEGNPLTLEVFQLKAGPDWPVGDRVPASASAMIWGETRPDEDPATLEALIRQALARAGIRSLQISPVIPPMPGNRLADDHPLVAAVQQSLRDFALNPDLITAPFACDGFHFGRAAETAVIVLGASGENAHAADEYVSIDSLMRLTEVLIDLALAWCQSG